MTSLTTSRHDLHKQSPGGVLLKKVFLKVSQNSQESSCAKVSFLYNLNKNQALGLVVSYEFSEIGLRLKYMRQMCAIVSWESVYMFCVYLNQIIINENLFTTNAGGSFIICLKNKNIITQILSIRYLIKFIWIIAPGSACAPGLTRDVCFESRVSPIISISDPSISALGLGS